MSKLDKDQVVADFTAAYKAKFGKAPQLEQKPGWFSVDGGKNIRLAELAELGASYGTAASSANKVAKSPNKAKPAEKQPAPAKAAAKPAKKPATRPAKTTAAKSGKGQSAAAAWAARFDGKQRQPRGYR